MVFLLLTVQKKARTLEFRRSTAGRLSAEHIYHLAVTFQRRGTQ